MTIINNPLNNQKTTPPTLLGNVGVEFLNLLPADWGWWHLLGILKRKVLLNVKSWNKKVYHFLSSLCRAGNCTRFSSTGNSSLWSWLISASCFTIVMCSLSVWLVFVSLVALLEYMWSFCCGAPFLLETSSSQPDFLMEGTVQITDKRHILSLVNFSG